MIDEATRSLLLENSTHREIILRFPDDDTPDIGSGNIVSESFELVDSICDAAEFRLGGGTASQMSIELVNITAALQGKKIAVYIRQQYIESVLYPQTSLFPDTSLYPGTREKEVEYILFTGRVFSFKRKKSNRNIFQLTTYNAIYDNSKITVSSTAVKYIAGASQTLKQFASQIMEMSDDVIELYGDPTATFNDSKTMDKITNELIDKVAGNNLSITDFLTAYAELNAAFFMCRRDGSFKLASLCEYESYNNTKKKDVNEVITYYSSLEFEEYVTAPITYIRFKYNDNQKKVYSGSEKGSWYLSENIILRMMTDASAFVTNFWKSGGTNYIFYNLYTYRPFKADVFARWWLEPGDRVQIQTGFEDTPVVDSFVLSRTIKGINGMKVTIEAKGKQFIGKKEDEE